MMPDVSDQRFSNYFRIQQTCKCEVSDLYIIFPWAIKCIAELSCLKLAHSASCISTTGPLSIVQESLEELQGPGLQEIKSSAVQSHSSL